MTVKLDESHGHALAIEGAEPTGYGLGKSGWVTVPLRAPGVTLDLLRDWIEESYRIVAPKRLVVELNSSPARIASTSAAAGNDGCAPCREAASAPAAHARRSASSDSTLEQRNEEAGGERVAGRRSVDGVDLRRSSARHLFPALEEHGALGPNVTAVMPPDVTDDLMLEPVDYEEVRLDVDLPCRSRVQAEIAGPFGRRVDGGVGDLELAEHCIRVPDLDITGFQLRVRARRGRRSSSRRRRIPRSAPRRWTHPARPHATTHQPPVGRRALPPRRSRGRQRK